MSQKNSKGTYLEGYNAGLQAQLEARNRALDERDEMARRVAELERVVAGLGVELGVEVGLELGVGAPRVVEQASGTAGATA